MKTYEAKYNPLINKGVYGISLVEAPAMEGFAIALKADSIQLKEVDKEQRILAGLVLEPNKPIYRNQNGEEFNIIFSDETVKELCYGFTKNNYNANSTIEHNDLQKIQGVTFVEHWIVRDEKNDTSQALGLKCKKGSWVAVMKVDNDEVWNDYVKTGKIKGFSIDAMLSLEEIKLKTEINMTTEILNALKGIPEAIKMAFQTATVKLGSVKLADGSLMIEFDGESLEAGAACWITADDETKVPVPVGEHPLEDGTILIVTQEGIVGEIKAAEAPADAEGEAAPVDAAKPENNDAQIANEIGNAIKSILVKYSEVEKSIEDLKAENVKLKAELLELSKAPAAKPIKAKPEQIDPAKLTNYQKLKLSRGEEI